MNIFRRICLAALILLQAATVDAASVNLSLGIRENQPLTVVGTNGVVPNNDITITTKTWHIARIPVYLGGDARKIVLTFDNWRLASNSGSVQNGDQAIVINKLRFEKGDGSLSVPVTFNNGLRNVTLPIGALDVQAEAILPDSFGLTQFDADSLWWVRICSNVAAAGDVLQGVNTDKIGTPGSGAYFYDATFGTNASACDQVESTGALTAPQQSNTDEFGYGPSAVLGNWVGAAKKSVLCWGDSLTTSNAELNDWPAPGPTFCSRFAWDGTSSTGTIAQMKIAVGGARASVYKANYNARWYLQYVNVLHMFVGTNDIGAGDSAATAIANLQVLYTAARTWNVQKIVGVGLWPRTNSTDSWATTAGQTPITFWGAGQPSETFNNSLAALVPGSIDYYFYMNSIRDSSDQWKWAATGTANYWVDNSTHPVSRGHEAIAAEERPLIESITVQ